MKGNQFQQSEKEPLFGLAIVNEKVRIVFGNNIISQKEFETFAEAEKYIAKKPYEIIINASILAMKFTQDEKNDNDHEHSTLGNFE